MGVAFLRFWVESVMMMVFLRRMGREGNWMTQSRLLLVIPAGVETCPDDKRFEHASLEGA